MTDTVTTTSFMTIYDNFLSRISSDMYMELTELDTIEMLQELLIDAIPRFEFPRVNIFDYNEGNWDDLGTYSGIESNYQAVPATGWVGGTFNCSLSVEEINILALNMVIEWLGQQLNTTELTKMRYSGSDFKLTSQANHMAKLKVMIDAQKQDCLHMQRLYKRRKVSENGIQSTLGDIISTPTYGVNENTINRIGFWSHGL